MTEKETWIEYIPKFAKHVKGQYTKLVLDPETKAREPQRVQARCEICGQNYRYECRQGMPRNHIVKFATIHSHKAMAQKGST